MSGQSKADRNEVSLFIISGRFYRFLFLYLEITSRKKSFLELYEREVGNRQLTIIPAGIIRRK
jgi:hypothetical protein